MRFQTRLGDRLAGCAWESRDNQPREIIVFQSMHSLVEDDYDPAAGHRPRLAYQAASCTPP
jgi:hypothetical protein